MQSASAPRLSTPLWMRRCAACLPAFTPALSAPKVGNQTPAVLLRGSGGSLIGSQLQPIAASVYCQGGGGCVLEGVRACVRACVGECSGARFHIVVRKPIGPARPPLSAHTPLHLLPSPPPPLPPPGVSESPAA